MLVPQQSARKTGVLAPAIASSCRSGPKDPPPPRKHQATVSPLRRRRHDVDAMVVTSAGPAGGREAPGQAGTAIDAQLVQLGRPVPSLPRAR